MTPEGADELLRRLTYKPNRKIFLSGGDAEGYAICILQDEVQDSTGRSPIPVVLIWTGYQISTHVLHGYGDLDILDLARDEVLRLEEHEAHEWLKLDGKLLYDPHDERGSHRERLALGGALHVPWKHGDQRDPK